MNDVNEKYCIIPEDQTESEEFNEEEYDAYVEEQYEGWMIENDKWY